MRLIGYVIKHRIDQGGKGLYYRGQSQDGLRPPVRFYGPNFNEAKVFETLDDARVEVETDVIARIFEELPNGGVK